MTFYVAHNSYS